MTLTLKICFIIASYCRNGILIIEFKRYKGHKTNKAKQKVIVLERQNIIHFMMFWRSDRRLLLLLVVISTFIHLFQVIKDYKLFMVVGVFLLLDIIILTTWQVVDPFYREVKRGDAVVSYTVNGAISKKATTSLEYMHLLR